MRESDDLTFASLLFFIIRYIFKKNITYKIIMLKSKNIILLFLIINNLLLAGEHGDINIKSTLQFASSLSTFFYLSNCLYFIKKIIEDKINNNFFAEDLYQLSKNNKYKIIKKRNRDRKFIVDSYEESSEEESEIIKKRNSNLIELIKEKINNNNIIINKHEQKIRYSLIMAGISFCGWAMSNEI